MLDVELYIFGFKVNKENEKKSNLIILNVHIDVNGIFFFSQRVSTLRNLSS